MSWEHYKGSKCLSQIQPTKLQIWPCLVTALSEDAPIAHITRLQMCPFYKKWVKFKWGLKIIIWPQIRMLWRNRVLGKVRERSKNMEDFATATLPNWSRPIYLTHQLPQHQSLCLQTRTKYREILLKISIISKIRCTSPQAWKATVSIPTILATIVSRGVLRAS